MTPNLTIQIVVPRSQGAQDYGSLTGLKNRTFIRFDEILISVPEHRSQQRRGLGSADQLLATQRDLNTASRP